MRPEDVQLSPGAQRAAHDRGLELADVRHARATGQPMRSFKLGSDEVWQFTGETLDGRGLIMFCSPPDIVTWVSEL
jgi:hypothetical protein